MTMHGCATKDILEAVGLTEKDLFNNVQEKPHVVAEYIYTDENKKPLYKVMRYEPKNFIQAKYNDGNWVFKMNDVRYVLYNLPKVIESDVVYFVEGEKDADNLNSIGLVATTTVSGASSFNKRAKEYCEFLKDKQILIIPDNDKSGYKYAEDIKKALDGIAKDTKILKLVDIVKELPEKGDISDVLKKYGKEETINILNKLIANYKEINISNKAELNIEELTQDELIDSKVFEHLSAIEDDIEREKIIIKLQEKAEKLNCLSNFNRILKKSEKKIKSQIKESKVTHNQIADLLREERKNVRFGKMLYIYKDGVYVQDRDTIERRILELVPDSKINFRNEVYEAMRLLADEVEINRESGIINFKNGLYDIKKGLLLEHDEKFFSINQIDIEYNKNAKKVKAVDDFFEDISCGKEERRQALLEMIGYCMTTSVKEQKAFILYGNKARNGKTTLNNIISKLIGRNNISNVSFEDINKGQFATSVINGKLLNIGAEMPSGFIRDVSAFKSLVGGDYISIEEKYKQKQTILPYVKLIFSANFLPNVNDNTNGFYRKLHIIPFERYFSDEEVNNFKFDNLITNEALQYLAKIAIDAYASKASLNFANEEESKKEIEHYIQYSDSISHFFYYNNYNKENNCSKNAQEVYNDYVEYCDEIGYKALGRNTFYRELTSKKGITIRQKNHQAEIQFKKSS